VAAAARPRNATLGAVATAARAFPRCPQGLDGNCATECAMRSAPRGAHRRSWGAKSLLCRVVAPASTNGRGFASRGSPVRSRSAPCGSAPAAPRSRCPQAAWRQPSDRSPSTPFGVNGRSKHPSTLDPPAPRTFAFLGPPPVHCTCVLDPAGWRIGEATWMSQDAFVVGAMAHTLPRR